MTKRRIPPARLLALGIVVAWWVGAGAVAFAQPPGPIGPYVLDLRATTMSLPTDLTFYPPDSATALIPGRAWGGQVAGQIYPGSLGPARVGIGAGLIRVRGTATVEDEESAVASVTVLAPDVSFNFGTGMGWSYISAGAGIGWVTTEVRRFDDPADGTASGGVMALNAGGGARWFTSRRLAVGFDVRLHRIGAGDLTPATTALAVSVGLSLR